MDKQDTVELSLQLVDDIVYLLNQMPNYRGAVTLPSGRKSSYQVAAALSKELKK